jgi:hypothetical protein
LRKINCDGLDFDGSLNERAHEHTRSRIVHNGPIREGVKDLAVGVTRAGQHVWTDSGASGLMNEGMKRVGVLARPSKTSAWRFRIV